MKLPLAKRIKRQAHRDIAQAQDMIVETLIEHVPGAVFHGGTCIWRCHGGNRFSDVLQFYLPGESFDAVFRDLSRQGFHIQKKKLSERSLYSTLRLRNTTVRLEGTFQTLRSELIDYEKIDGTIITVPGLTKEELLREKAITYSKRRKVRDLYDVFFLLAHVPAREAREELRTLLDGYERPVDEEDLKVLVLHGHTPTADQMITYIRRKWQST